MDKMKGTYEERKMRLKRDLWKFYFEFGILPSTQKLNSAEGYYSSATYSFYFGSLKNAMFEAGLINDKSLRKKKGYEDINIDMDEKVIKCL